MMTNVDNVLLNPPELEEKHTLLEIKVGSVACQGPST